VNSANTLRLRLCGGRPRERPPEHFHCEKVEPLRADFQENPRRETAARRMCFVVKQAFQSENVPDV
jgi:hypothetical protein